MSDKLSLGDLGYPTVETTRRAQAYHDILSDLLDEVAGCHYSCECINCHWARLAADRAEARLNELDAPPKPANERINLGGDSVG